MEHEFLTGKCPKCGEKLQIPRGLTEFSCLYCGARLKESDLAAPPAPSEAAAYYHDHVLSALTDYEGYEKKLTKAEFEPAFAAYAKGTERIFRQLEEAVSGGLLTPEAAAQDFLDQLEAYWQSLPNHHGRITLSQEDAHKFILAIFLVPSVRNLKLSCGEPYCQALRDQWCRRHPKNPFNLGTYEDISGGFRRKYFGGLCFITTAVCRDSGKADDCPELSAFRNFRDGYLRSCPDGPALIEEYYDVAPGIVLRIDLSSDPSAVYRRLWEDCLKPCYAHIQSGRLKACKETYVRMVRELEEEYLN